MTRLEKAGFISDMFGCALAQADIRIAQGRLHDAMAACERALRSRSITAQPRCAAWRHARRHRHPPPRARRLDAAGGTSP